MSHSRLFGLAFVTLIVIGNSWVYDTPGAISSAIAERFGASYTISNTRLLYSVYSWPNVVLAFLGGLMIDRWLGLRRSTLLFATFVMIGQIIFAVALQLRVFWAAPLGRAVFGLGGETLKVAQNTWIPKFANSENIAVTFGLVLSVARIAGAVNFAVTPTLAAQSVPLAVWTGTVLTVLSFFATSVLVSSHYHGQHADIDAAEANEPEPFATILKREINSICQAVASFSAQVWLQFAICVFYHIGVLLLFQIVSDILQQTGDQYSERFASLIVSLPAFLAVAGTPLSGYLIDRYGHAMKSIAVACIILGAAHMMLIAYVLDWASSSGPSGLVLTIFAMLLVGVSYSVATSAIWPMVPSLLQESQLAIGYGAMSSIENIGLAVMPLIINEVQTAPNIADTRWQYALPLLLLLFTDIVAFFLVLAQHRIDRTRSGGRLEWSAVKRAGHADNVAAPVPAIV